MAIRLLNSGVDLIPSANVTNFEARTQASAGTQPDISGVPVVVLAEIQGSDAAWSMSIAYQPLAVVQACQAAYQAGTVLSLVDENAVATNVKVKEYPTLVRHKQMGQVVYSISLILQAEASAPTITTISTTGPRLFH